MLWKMQCFTSQSMGHTNHKFPTGMFQLHKVTVFVVVVAVVVVVIYF